MQGNIWSENHQSCTNNVYLLQFSYSRSAEKRKNLTSGSVLSPAFTPKDAILTKQDRISSRDKNTSTPLDVSLKMHRENKRVRVRSGKYSRDEFIVRKRVR